MRVCGRAGSSRANASARSAADLAGADDDQVEVGHQGERAAALPGAVVQDDRAGLGDRDRAARHDAGHPVEFGRRERRGVAGQRRCRGQPGQPSGRQPVRHDERAGRGGGACGQHAGDGRGEAGLRGPARRRRGSRRPARRTARRCRARRRRGGRAGTPAGQRPRTPRRRRGPRRRRARPLAGRRARGGRWRRGSWPGSGPSTCSSTGLPWSWPTRRGTIPAAGRGRRGFRSSRSAAAAAA